MRGNRSLRRLAWQQGSSQTLREASGRVEMKEGREHGRVKWSPTSPREREPLGGLLAKMEVRVQEAES